MNTPKLPPLPDLGPEWTPHWTKVVHEKMQAYALAAIEAQVVPDGWHIKLQAQIRHLLEDCVSEETHDGLTFYAVDRTVTSSNLILALMRLFASAPPAPQAVDNWRKYATEREDTAQAVIERHRKEHESLLRLLAKDRQTIADLKAGVAQQEPVMIYHGDCTIDCGEHGHHNVELLKMIPAGSLLYNHPAPQAKPQPLTDEQINKMWSDAHNDTSIMSLIHVLARAIEAAHNIGEKE